MVRNHLCRGRSSLRKRGNASSSLSDLVQELAYNPESFLITKPAREFTSTSIGKIMDRASCRRHSRGFWRRTRLARERWLTKEFPNEVWDLPALTALYLGEACSCYVNGEYFASLILCHAINESFVKGAYRASKRPPRTTWKRFVEELPDLTPAGKRYLRWIADLRNSLLHVGTDEDYAKAINFATTPIVLKGKTLPIPAIVTICKIALSATIEFVRSKSVHKNKSS